jgi:hypothetical protein
MLRFGPLHIIDQTERVALGGAGRTHLALLFSWMDG